MVAQAPASVPLAPAELTSAPGASLPEGRASLPEGRASLPEGRAPLPEGRAPLPDASLPEGRAPLPEGRARASLPEGRARRSTSLPRRPIARPGPSPAPRGLPGKVVAAGACASLGLAALAWVPASLWPGAGLPAWPAVSLGLLAVLVSWGRGGALLRALGGIAGLLAAIAGAAQITVLWLAAWVVSYM